MSDPRAATHRQKGGQPQCGWPLDQAPRMTLTNADVTCDRCRTIMGEDVLAAAMWNAYLGR